MNCSQARAMMTAYHESKNETEETIELDAHLERCASCRQELSRQMFVGEQLRSLPLVEPRPDMHSKLMHALANEQLDFIRHSAPGTVSTPEFLKPYLHEHAQSTQASNLVAAFSTAETGPLPIIHAKRKSRHRSHMSQFAVLGLAAMFLMVLMMGGLTSLLLLSHNNESGINPSRSVEKLNLPSTVDQIKYTTNVPFPHVASAVGDQTYIYYTAYRDGLNNPWMLERLDRTTNSSTPLLPKASPDPLIVLGSAQGSLVWLQFDGLKLKPHGHLAKFGLHPYTNLWSLHYLTLQQQQQMVSGISTDSEILLKGTFDQDTAPKWVTTPIQGVWFTQNSLLAAITDSKGISHLLRFQLDANGKIAPKEIATTVSGHVLISPTANSDGSQIYWSEEWLSSTGSLYSNIWTQQVIDATKPMRGLWVDHTVTMKHLFSSDGESFHPQIANNTLFTLSTAIQNNSTQATSTPTGPATPVPSPAPNSNAISRTDTSIYAAPLDSTVRGTVLMLPLSGDSGTAPTAVNNAGLASSLQVGTDFALWQGDKGYEMYDVSQRSNVIVGSILDGSTFVAVNGTSAVWMINNGSSTNTSNNAGISSITLNAFNWPAK